MAKKRKESVEFRFYELPSGQSALMLVGESWRRIYGHDIRDAEGNPKLHFHNLMEIGYCHEGKGHILLEDGTCDYKAGTITIIPENYPHHTESAEKIENYWEFIFFEPKTSIMELYPDNPRVQRDAVEKINRGPIVLDAEDNPALERLVLALLDEAREKRPYSSRMINLYTLAILTEIMRVNKEMPYYPYEIPRKNTMDQIACAFDYVDEHYMENIKVIDMAKACNISETHFRRIFDECVNMPPSDYVNLVRIQRACELLKKSTDSMESIAMKCGFPTISTFNRNFKKFLGTSPLHWKTNPANYEGKLMNFNVSVKRGW